MRGKIYRFGPKVFQQERHTPERPIGQAIGYGFARHVFLHKHHGVDGGVARGHTCKRLIEQLIGGNLAFGDKRRKAGCVIFIIHMRAAIGCYACPRLANA